MTLGIAMRLSYQGPLPEMVGFLLLPQYSMMAFFAAVEPLRIANRIAHRPLFDWTLISADGGPVTASNGMTLMVERRMFTIYPRWRYAAVLPPRRILPGR